MTTIAFKDGVFAADSQATWNQMAIATPSSKILTTNNLICAASGDCDRRILNALLEEVESSNDMPNAGELGEHVELTSCLIWFKNEAALYMIQTGSDGQGFQGFFMEVKEDFMSLGTGKEIAMGAMAAGASAVEAIRIAAKYDIYTGGKIISKKV